MPTIESLPGDGLRLDSTDQEIIAQLLSDANTSNVELAKMVNMSARAVASRLQNLFDNDVIKIIARLDIKMLGYSRLAMVQIHRPTAALLKALQRSPWVFTTANAPTENCLYIVGGFNELTTFRDELYLFLSKHAPQASCSFDECTEVFKYDFSAASFIDERLPKPVTDRFLQFSKEFCDDTDYEILRHLTQDATQSNRKIARDMGLSENTIRKHLKALVDKKLVKIGTVINASMRYSNQLIFVGEIDVPPVNYPAAVAMLKDNPSVHYLAHTTGRNNLSFDVLFTDRAEMESFCEELDQLVDHKSLHLVNSVPEIFRHEFFVDLVGSSVGWQRRWIFTTNR